MIVEMCTFCKRWGGSRNAIPPNNYIDEIEHWNNLVSSISQTLKANSFILSLQNPAKKAVITFTSQMRKLRLREPKKCVLNYKFSRLLGSAAQPGHSISVFTKIKWCPFACIFSFKPYKNRVEVGRVIIIFPKLKEKGIKLSYSSLLPL